MKRVILGFSALALSTAFILSCKPKKSDPPVADKEVKSSLYASWMNYVVTDIDMVCSFMAENTYSATFYSPYPATGATVSVTRDTIDNIDHEDQMAMSWNQTRCMDGNVRDGSIRMYVKQLPNKRYSRDPQWEGRIRLSNYKVNGWLIELYNPDAPLYIYNTVPVSQPNGAATKPTDQNWTWRIAGKLKFTLATDPNKNMIWDGELYKTLTNTSDPKVFASTKGAITWTNSIISYYGRFDGSGPQIKDVDETTEEVTGGASYSMTINKETPLIRDFQCSPDRISGVALTSTNSLQSRGDEHHPFKSGIASFTVGSSYPRQIYYGNEGEPSLDVQCDNTGEVMIKGISYRVDFMK